MWKFVVKYFVTKMRCDEMWWDVVIKIVIRCCESFVIKCFIICFIVCCEIFYDEMWWDVAKWDVVKELSLIYCESLWRDVVKVLWWDVCCEIFCDKMLWKFCCESFVIKCFIICFIVCCEIFCDEVLWWSCDVELYHSLLK